MPNLEPRISVTCATPLVLSYAPSPLSPAVVPSVPASQGSTPQSQSQNALPTVPPVEMLVSLGSLLISLRERSTFPSEMSLCGAHANHEQNCLIVGKRRMSVPISVLTCLHSRSRPSHHCHKIHLQQSCKLGACLWMWRIFGLRVRFGRWQIWYGCIGSDTPFHLLKSIHTALVTNSNLSALRIVENQRLVEHKQ